MRIKFIYPVLVLTAIAVLSFGCSSDDDSSPAGPGGSFSSANLLQLTDLVGNVAPPVYSAPAPAPGVIGDWTSGDYPLLGKVFGEDEPMSLYANLENLDMSIEIMNQLLKVDEEGNYIADSSWATVNNLSSPTSIPTEAAAIFGFSTLQVDQVAIINPPDMQGAVYQVGFTKSETSQTILAFYSGPTFDQLGATESFLYYAEASLADSTVDIKGVFYKDYGDQTSARWIYDIQSDADTNFAYKMAWYDDDFGGESGVGSIIGGGNKDTEFALKFRQWRPADTTVVDSNYVLDQLFGPNYADHGTTISAGYDEYTNEASMFDYSDMPSALLEEVF